MDGSTRPHDRPDGEDAQLDLLRGQVRRARRSTPIGAGAGLVAGVLLSVALTSAGGPVLVRMALLVAPVTLFGALIGHVVGGGRLGKAVGDAAGSDVAAERIKRAVAGEHETLAPGEQARAARYAAVAAIALPAQAQRWWLTVAAIAVGQILHLTIGQVIFDGPSVDAVISAIPSLLAAVLLVGTALALRRGAERARAYSAAHPIGDERRP